MARKSAHNWHEIKIYGSITEPNSPLEWTVSPLNLFVSTYLTRYMIQIIILTWISQNFLNLLTFLWQISTFTYNWKPHCRVNAVYERHSLRIQEHFHIFLFHDNCLNFCVLIHQNRCCHIVLECIWFKYVNYSVIQ